MVLIHMSISNSSTFLSRACSHRYTLSESAKSEQLQESSGRIFYQPDDADDFDDEDPDDDLDI